jgi:hypothetical protein
MCTCNMLVQRTVKRKFLRWRASIPILEHHFGCSYVTPLVEQRLCLRAETNVPGKQNEAVRTASEALHLSERNQIHNAAMGGSKRWVWPPNDSYCDHDRSQKQMCVHIIYSSRELSSKSDCVGGPVSLYLHMIFAVHMSLLEQRLCLRAETKRF